MDRHNIPDFEVDTVLYNDLKDELSTFNVIFEDGSSNLRIDGSQERSEDQVG